MENSFPKVWYAVETKQKQTPLYFFHGFFVAADLKIDDTVSYRELSIVEIFTLPALVVVCNVDP